MGITSTWCFSLIVPYKVKEHLWQDPKCLEEWLFLKNFYVYMKLHGTKIICYLSLKS